MRIRVNAPGPSPVSFGTVKRVLECAGVGPDTADARLARAIRLYYPLDRRLAEFVRAEAISMTDAATAGEQIRYFQSRRLERNHIVVAEHIRVAAGSVDLEIGSCDFIDGPSREFLAIASGVAGWRITYSSDVLDGTEAESGRSEAQPAGALDEGAPADQVVEAAWEFINVGDAWTGIALGRRALAREQSAQVWNLLAVGNAMLRETERAEFYYNEWARRGSKLDKVRALYGKSMLYARHHPDGLRDIDVAADCLSSAHRLMEDLSSEGISSDTLVFEEVFNRNGFALVLFRRGQVDEALRLLHEGIDRLTATSERVAIHRSVLIYNLAQCYRQLGDLESAVSTYDRLLEVDPHMAEYHLEAAKCLSAAGDHERALAECEAAVQLDETLAISWRMLGRARLTCGRLDDAADAYRRAVHLEPRNATRRADAAFALIRAHRSDEALDLLTAVQIESLSPAEIERHFSLVAEAHLQNDRAGDAADQLTMGRVLHPSSRVLADNLQKVLTRR